MEHAGHVASDTSIQYPHIFPDVELITGATPCFRYQESSRVGRLGVRRYQIRQQIPGYIRAEAEDTPALILMSQHQTPVRLNAALRKVKLFGIYFLNQAAFHSVPAKSAIILETSSNLSYYKRLHDVCVSVPC